MTRPGPTSKRMLSSTLASALCGSLLLNALPAFAQTPAPVPGAAPSNPPPPAGAQAPAGAPQPVPSAVSPVDVPGAPPASPSAPAAQPAPIAPPTSEAPPMGAAPPAMPPMEPTAVAPPPMEPAPEAPPPSPPPENSNLPSYLMWGVGGASLIVGTAFGIAAVTGESHYNDNPTFSKADSVHTRALVSDIGLGLGVILIASGTVFYFVRDAPPAAEHAQRAPSSLARLGVSPIVGLKTQGAAVTLNF